MQHERKRKGKTLSGFKKAKEKSKQEGESLAFYFWTILAFKSEALVKGLQPGLL